MPKGAFPPWVGVAESDFLSGIFARFFTGKNRGITFIPSEGRMSGSRQSAVATSPGVVIVWRELCDKQFYYIIFWPQKILTND
jgi:hypothetical protein